MTKKKAPKRHAKKMSKPVSAKAQLHKVKATLKKSAVHHKMLKKHVTTAIKKGDHDTAASAIGLLEQSKEAFHDLIQYLQGHASKKRAHAAKQNRA